MFKTKMTSFFEFKDNYILNVQSTIKYQVKEDIDWDNKFEFEQYIWDNSPIEIMSTEIFYQHEYMEHYAHWLPFKEQNNYLNEIMLNSILNGDYNYFFEHEAKRNIGSQLVI